MTPFTEGGEQAILGQDRLLLEMGFGVAGGGRRSFEPMNVGAAPAVGGDADEAVLEPPNAEAELREAARRQSGRGQAAARLGDPRILQGAEHAAGAVRESCGEAAQACALGAGRISGAADCAPR